MKLYENLAEQIAEMIRLGVLSPGDKAPSIRHASERFSVSPSTVFRAYYLLESKGLLQARERYGYYICPPPAPQLDALEPTSPSSHATDVSVDSLVSTLLSSNTGLEFRALGAAFPDRSLFPLKRLAQCSNQASKDEMLVGDASNVSPGNSELRKAIARRYMSAGVNVTDRDIVITNGALEALSLALQTVTKPGDTVVIESPGFYAPLQLIRMLQLRAIEIPMHPNDGMDLDVLQNVLTENQVSACWCMTNLQNPLGSTMSSVKKQQLVDLLDEHAVPLIEDDVYGELFFGQSYPTPTKSFDHKGGVIHCSSFSKSLAPGYRIGWVIPGRFYDTIRQAKLITSLSAPIPGQLAVADYLKRGLYDRHLRKLRATLESLQAEMIAAIGEYFPSGTRVSRPAGGYFLWVQLPDGLDAMSLYHRALKDSIVIAPGPMFSAVGEYKDCIRLNYGINRALIVPGIKKLGEHLTEIQLNEAKRYGY